MTKETYDRSTIGLAHDIDWFEEVQAGSDTDAVGHWKTSVWRSDGKWFAEVECLFGISEVGEIGDPNGEVSFPGPIDFEILEATLGPFGSYALALNAVVARLLASVALLSGDWEPRAEPLDWEAE
jgi:hypothetical protein